MCARCSHTSASCNSIAARLSCNCLIIAACKPCKMTLSEVCNFPNCLSKVERELIAGNLTLKNLLRHNFVSFAASLLIFILLNPDLTWGGGCRLSLFPAQLFSVVWLSVAVSGVSYDPEIVTMYQCWGRVSRQQRCWRHSRSVSVLRHPPLKSPLPTVSSFVTGNIAISCRSLSKHQQFLLHARKNLRTSFNFYRIGV